MTKEKKKNIEMFFWSGFLEVAMDLLVVYRGHRSFGNGLDNSLQEDADQCHLSTFAKNCLLVATK